MSNKPVIKHEALGGELKLGVILNDENELELRTDEGRGDTIAFLNCSDVMAEAIVNAFNSHYELLEACKLARFILSMAKMDGKINETEAISKLDKAIAKAEANG